MKKPPAKNNRPKRHSKFITWKRLLMALGVVVLLVAGLIAYWAYSYNTAQNKQFAIDKQHFAQADTDMQQAYNAIVQSVGSPYEMKETKSCGYQYTEQFFTRGPLSCGITYVFTYSVLSDDQGQALTGKIIGAIKNSGNKLYFPNVQPPDFDIASSKVLLNYSFVTQPNQKIGCELDYQYYSQDQYNTYGKSIAGLNDNVATAAAQYKLNCGGRPAKPLYKITD